VKASQSIRGRVLRTQFVWSLLGGVALATALWLAMQSEVDELLDDSLRSAAELLIGPALELAAAAAPQAPTAAAPAPERNGGPRFVWQLVHHGRVPTVLAAAANAPVQAMADTPSAGFIDVPGWRLYGRAVGEPGRMLYVAQSRDERAEAKLEMAFAALLAGAPLLLLGMLWLNMRLRQDLQPLQVLSARLADFDALQPGASLGVADYDELRPVQAAIDALVARLARRITLERAFSAHTAHALRTPLAGIEVQLAMALREAPAALVPRLQRVRTGAARLQNVVAALLAMFRSGTEVERAPLDLAQLAARLPVEGLELKVQATEALWGDADLVTAALLNLLDNALRHGAQLVTLSTPRAGWLCVHDDGTGLIQARLHDLQAALLAQDYEGRMGLGLMLADMVARAHGGSLILPDSGPGFTAVLDLGTLPASTPPLPAPRDD